MRPIDPDVLAACVPVDVAAGVPAMAGVYFCIQDGLVVYVGQSKNVAVRARAAVRRISPAPSVVCLPMPNSTKEARLRSESFFIGRYGQAMPEERGVIYVRLPDWLKQRLQAEADKRLVTTADIVREILLARYEQPAQVQR